MKTNKAILAATSLLALLCPLSGCAQSSVIRLKRPEQTDLEFWITEEATSEDLIRQGCAYLPGWQGAEEYLDSRYTALQNDGALAVPDVHVTYLLTGYPDILDEPSITRIEITDPAIRVYGLTIGAVADQIRHRVEGIATSVDYKKVGEEYATVALIQNCRFVFSDDAITISAPVSNKQNVEF